MDALFEFMDIGFAWFYLRIIILHIDLPIRSVFNGIVVVK